MNDFVSPSSSNVTDGPFPARAIKTCCAKFYAGEAARLLLGDSSHPGGDRLTERLGRALALGPADRVLDVACGDGHSALVLAREFGCSVVGVDYSPLNIRRAAQAARAAGLEGRVQFCCGDGETLPVATGAFGVVVCECAFCTFPDKQSGAREMRRALARGGRLGLSDVTLERPLPPDLRQLATWVMCIADARRGADYQVILQEAGFAQFTQGDHSWALRSIVGDAGRRLLAVEAAHKLGVLPGIELDLVAAKGMLRRVAEFIEVGGAGYVLLTASAEPSPLSVEPD